MISNSGISKINLLNIRYKLITYKLNKKIQNTKNNNQYLMLIIMSIKIASL